MNTQRQSQLPQSVAERRDVAKGQRMLMAILVAGLLLAVAMAMTQAQEPEEEIETVKGVEGVSNVVPIQGRLSDAAGNPLNGLYEVTARIYNVDQGGSHLCRDVDDVSVVNGLFNMDMHGCTASDIDGEQLYLGIQVDEDGEMTPRQAIYPVPYAWTVKPGAIIKGAVTYHFVPGSTFVGSGSTTSLQWQVMDGAVRLWGQPSGGGRLIHYPIALPSVLYGQPARVSEIRVYYKCEDGASGYISRVRMTKQIDADTSYGLVDDETNRTSNSATSFDLPTIDPWNVLATDEGILSVNLSLMFLDDAHYVQIGGVRLTLEYDYEDGGAP